MNLENVKRSAKRRHLLDICACCAFVAAIGFSYCANFLIQAVVYQDSFWDLFFHFACPICAVVCLYIVECEKGYLSGFLCRQLPKAPIVAYAAPVIAALVGYIYCEKGISILLLSTLAMAIAPYAFRYCVEKALCLIVVEAVGFILLAVRLEDNISAMVVAFVVAAVLISAIPKLQWFHREKYVKQKSRVALAMLICAVLLLFFIEDSGVQEAIIARSAGRPGLGSSLATDRICREVLANAKWIGAADVNYAIESVCVNRLFTLVLGTCGWLGVLPLLIACVLVISSGIYICRKSIRTRRYLAVAFMTLIAVQMISYILLCVGIDLFFPEICPFFGEYFMNIAFLIMAMIILPPKKKKIMQNNEK